MPTRVLFVQYFNPGAYPPLVHASHILAERGAEVRFVGVFQPRTKDLVVGEHPRIRVELVPAGTQGWRLKTHYFRWLITVMTRVIRWNPDIVYASDPFAAPAGLIAALVGTRVVYHEHDAPPKDDGRLTPFMRAVLASRRMLARRAALGVFPGEERVALFRPMASVHTPLVSVINCPRRSEVVFPVPSAPESSAVVLHYHGSLAPQRLPLAAVRALTLLPENTYLQIIGYNAIDAEDYTDEIVTLAQELGVGERVLVRGALSSRQQMLQMASEATIGLLLMRGGADDPNSETMGGASNKMYEYFGAGLPVIVSRDSGLQGVVVRNRAGVACDESDPEAIAGAVRDLLEHPDFREMGRRNRNRVLSEWNYDRQFAPVLTHVLGQDLR